MIRILFALFIISHGLVHLWYVALSQRLVEFQPEMGWSGRSWLFTNMLGDSTTRLVATVFLMLATAGFVVAGAGVFIRAEWWRPLLLGAAVLSGAILLVLWDGSTQLIVEKGLIGLLINAAIVVLLLLNW